MKPIEFIKRPNNLVGISGINSSSVFVELKRILRQNKSEFIIKAFDSGLLIGARKGSPLQFKVIDNNTLRIEGFRHSSLLLKILQLIPLRAEYSLERNELVLFSMNRLNQPD